MKDLKCFRSTNAMCPTWVCQNLFGLGDVNELLLSLFLFLWILEVVWMPLLSQLPVRPDDLLLLSRPETLTWTCSVLTRPNIKVWTRQLWRLLPLDSQDLVVVSFLGLFQKPLGSLQAFFNLTVVFTVFCCRLVVPDS